MSARRPRTIERRLACQVALYTVEQLNAKGEVVEIGKVARRGDLMVLNARELARLEGLGVLCPEGWSVADLDESDEHVHSAYVAARQAIVQGTVEGY